MICTLAVMIMKWATYCCECSGYNTPNGNTVSVHKTTHICMKKALGHTKNIYIYIASTDRSEQPRGERWDSPPSPRPPGPCGAPGSGQRPHGHPANQICTVNLDPDPEFSWKSDTVNLDPDRVHVVTLPYNRRHLATFVPMTIGQYNYTGIRMTFLLEWRRGLGKWERGKPKSA